MEELYEELPNEQDEELYEDLPCNYGDESPYYPGGGISPTMTTDSAPPPLPTSAIPHRPGSVHCSPASQPSQPPPPLPTRAVSTTLTSQSSKTLPPTAKNKQAAKKKTATLNKLGGGGGGGGGGGIDLSEIKKRARERSDKALFDLEHKKDHKDEDEKHVAPWANQLRKTRPKPTTTTDDVVNGHDTNDDVPEFMKKRKALGQHEGSGSDSSPPTAPRPIAAPKPVRMPTPATVQTKSVDSQQPEVQEKPPWLKQRERQANLAKMTSDSKPPPPATKPPPPASKPPPPSPLERSMSPNRSPPPPKKKPKPVPIPRKPSSENLYPLPTRTEIKGSPIVENNKQESPPNTPSSVRDRARTLERSMKSESSTPPQSPKPPPPKPVPRSKPVPLEKPARDVSPSLPLKAPAPAPVPPTRQKEAPPLPPPNKSPAPPPIPSKGAPSSSSPFPFPPATHAEPTPPTGSVVKFRRLPLQSVDLFNPPPLPSRNAKPAIPAGAIVPVPEEDEIYDDTLGLPDQQQNGVLEDGPEDLYDDVERPPPPPKSAPPSSRPPAPSTSPPGPPTPTEAPPPLPLSAPPSKRPSAVSPYETQEFSGGGDSNGPIPIIEEEQETYEDVSPYADRSLINNSSTLSTGPTSATSLVPPSPQHSVSSLEHEASPTLTRRQKLTKDERKQMKEEEKREKERKRQEKEREKERKRKEEIRMKNRQKGIKVFKQFPLKIDIQPLFTIEILQNYSKSKDHLNVTAGEMAFVLLIAHDKLDPDKYLAEKEDGTIGLVNKNIAQRTVSHQSAQSIGSTSPLATSIGSPIIDYPEPEDIYESLPQDEDDFGPPPLAGGPPAPGVPLPNPGGFRYPAPSQAPPPPPPNDGPEETYEELPADG